MKSRWSILLLLLSGSMLLVTGCSSRVTDTPQPPLIPATTSEPAVPPTQQQTAPPVETQSPPPELVNRPEMTIQGNLEGDIPFGITADGHFFKGDPQAPLIFFEFSDYQ